MELEEPFLPVRLEDEEESPPPRSLSKEAESSMQKALAASPNVGGNDIELPSESGAADKVPNAAERTVVESIPPARTTMTRGIQTP